MPERVIKLNRFELPGARGAVHSWWANQMAPVSAPSVHAANDESNRRKDSDEFAYWVYTKGEIDDQLTKLTSSTSELRSSLESTTIALRNEIADAVERLPVRILVDTILESLQARILARVDERIGKLERELQAQLDELKRQAAAPR